MDYRLVEQVLRLAFDAGRYRNYTLADIDACIFSAIRHDKALTWFNDKGLCGLTTFCFLPPDRANLFLSEKHFITYDDFAINDGELIIVDFLAPYGGVIKMVREGRNHMAKLYGHGVVGRWKRTWREQPKLGNALTRGNAHEHS